MLEQKLNYYWRLFGTAVSFGVFGIGSLLLAFCIFPIIHFLFCFKKFSNIKSYLMRRIIRFSWQLFIGIMCSLQVLSLKIKNIEQIKNSKQQIIVANHPSLIDIVILISLIPNSTCIVKEALANNFFMKYVVKASFILNSTNPEQLLETCNLALKDNLNIIIFPEGSRSIPNQKSKLSRGAPHIALYSQSNILPIRIDCRPLTLIKNQAWYIIPDTKPVFTLEAKPILLTSKYIQKHLSKQKMAKNLILDLKKILEID